MALARHLWSVAKSDRAEDLAGLVQDATAPRLVQSAAAAGLAYIDVARGTGLRAHGNPWARHAGAALAHADAGDAARAVGAAEAFLAPPPTEQPFVCPEFVAQLAPVLIESVLAHAPRGVFVKFIVLALSSGVIPTVDLRPTARVLHVLVGLAADENAHSYLHLIYRLSRAISAASRRDFFLVLGAEARPRRLLSRLLAYPFSPAEKQWLSEKGSDKMVSDAAGGKNGHSESVVSGGISDGGRRPADGDRGIFDSGIFDGNWGVSNMNVNTGLGTSTTAPSPSASRPRTPAPGTLAPSKTTTSTLAPSTPTRATAAGAARPSTPTLSLLRRGPGSPWRPGSRAGERTSPAKAGPALAAPGPSPSALPRNTALDPAIAATLAAADEPKEMLVDEPVGEPRRAKKARAGGRRKEAPAPAPAPARRSARLAKR